METRQTKWNKNNPVKVKLFNMLGVIKRKCLKDGIKYDLTPDWLRDKLEGVCEVTGTPFDLHQAKGPFLPVIQRVDDSAGYTVDNSRVVIQIYSIANDEHTLYQFCKQYTTIYDILHATPTFPPVG